MAKKKRATAPRKKKEPWEELLAFMAKQKYRVKLEMAQYLVSKGFTVSVASVISTLRKTGECMVYGWARGAYTLKPDGGESLISLRRRFLMARSAVLNARGELTYYKSNSKRLHGQLDKENAAFIKGLAKWFDEAIAFMDRTARKYGLI